MRYKEFRILEQSAPGTVSIVVYFEDNTTQTIEDIPLSVFNSPDFMSVLKDKFKKYKKVVVKYSKVGDTTTQGNPDGKTPDTKNPTVMTTTKPSDDKIAQKPDEVEAPTNTSKWDNPMQVELYSAQQLDNMNAASAAQDKREQTIDKNSDGKNDITGEKLPIIYNDGSLRDPFNTKKIVGYVPGATPVAKKGGGSGGEEGEGGEAGGGLTSEMEKEIPNIVKLLHDGFSPGLTGLGTAETKVFKALSMVKNKAHMDEVNKEYGKKYNENLGSRIASEFRNESSTNLNIKELNYYLEKVGYTAKIKSLGLLGNNIIIVPYTKGDN